MANQSNNDPLSGDMVADPEANMAALNETNYNVVSGQPITFDLQILDQNGEIYSDENSATAAYKRVDP
eukprot:CAMPEP_0176348844 /NCGR_PEP_ID=MMETSP0126-20121128/8200_1 /TAXON_ID=141414 ORGANISM="Strombidinopsis acuminatum, Strain SPMC142" /NCGR_SAMPLE_ID=MMETSP0126 /ASSEMBLY_ACC=CAM_ASM_000229 /LENGTH=67 /DNA_ID=CAMNT_0017697899 /DNA_START=2979 /DNA_END=3182 /DNA_ORIENTATION=-